MECPTSGTAIEIKSVVANDALNFLKRRAIVARTAKQRAALRKAQLASARKRRGRGKAVKKKSTTSKRTPKRTPKRTFVPSSKKMHYARTIIKVGAAGALVGAAIDSAASVGLTAYMNRGPNVVGKGRAMGQAAKMGAASGLRSGLFWGGAMGLAIAANTVPGRYKKNKKRRRK